ncbi:TonB-dependent receptor plug domain-containing protein [Flavobacterium caeni]|uniref:Outer membrane receptor for ferrienterochelin and colicins n=1 Tax=Flavobacterium caeni TaxID=490189 RepID=A0A1G5FER1_9FLAO|nr:TonB-dependent receptor [Flavobacterium caeni]SCY37759.1 outer membrane receptor for ferrienterochelin and colicins [Flavobacterium caeni]
MHSSLRHFFNRFAPTAPVCAGVRPSTKHYSLFILLTISGAHAQNDTIRKAKPLDEVVITGQYSKQSVDKSVYQVKVISRADIDRQAGNNLADLLNQQLNINIIPSASSGKSSVRLFGLDAQYFKILIDNIPVINDEGLGNNTDLTQINLDDVQQIEIVEGSMGVEYGANAISGIINIITKKSGKSKWEITPFIQEETVGDEYSLMKRGRHIQSLKIGHNINSRLYANAMVTTNYFKGFLDDRQGKDHLYNDGQRGYRWLPKDQVNAKAFLGYNLDNHAFFYKFEFFDESTDFYSQNVQENPQPQTGTIHPVTFDDNTFISTRYFHHFNATGKFSFMDYDISTSFQQQERNVETFKYRIGERQKYDVEKTEYESREGFHSRGNFSNFLKNETIDFQVGYEISEITGHLSYLTGVLFDGSLEKRLGSYDAFASTEINFTKRFSLRPGARVMFSSQFDTQAALSLSSRYDLGKGYQLRAVVGTAPRIPNYEELYTYFVDVNHDSQGNPNLKPEQGTSVSLFLNKTFASQSGALFRTSLNGFFLDVRDRIEQITYTNDEGKLAFTFDNIDLFRTYGGTLTTGFQYRNWSGNAGVTVSGTSKVLDILSASEQADDYLVAMQYNANLSHTLAKTGTIFSAYLKYTGPQYQFIQVPSTGEIVKGRQNEFTWLDASIMQPFLNRTLELTIGARNLLDITQVNTSTDGGGTHTAASSSVMLGYGRSYFMKLRYRLNF